MSEPTPEGREFLKCDAPDCDHFEMTPVTIEIVDKPCPKCGANLCTKEDFIIFQTVVASSRALNQVILRDNPGMPTKLVATNFHNGVLKFSDGPVMGVNPFPNKPEES